MFEQQVPATRFGCVPSRRRKMRTSRFKPIVSFVMSAAVDVNDEQTRSLAGWYADKRARVCLPQAAQLLGVCGCIFKAVRTSGPFISETGERWPAVVRKS